MRCKDCGENERSTSGRCVPCQREFRTAQAASRRQRLRAALAEKNDRLELKGKRVCGQCIKVRALSEFGTSMGGGLGKRNKICDRCLSSLYETRGRCLAYGFWRARAYSLNSVARSRLSRELLRPISLKDLSFVFKPQDLVLLFGSQSGRCCYCRVKLTTLNASVDHLTPLSRGGEHALENAKLACRDCNYLKASRTEEEFLVFVRKYAKRFCE